MGEELPKCVRADPPHGTGDYDACGQKRILGGEEVQLTHELTRPEPVEDLLGLPVGGLADNFNDGIVGEEQVNVGVAGLKKRLPQRHWFRAG